MNQDHFKKKYSLLQSDSSEEDEIETDLVSIRLDNGQIIQIHYSQLCKHSKLIRDKYLISDVRTQLSKDIQKFQQENNINSNNLISFLQLIRDEDIEMTNDKYFDFYKLSDFFQIKKLSKNLDKYYKQNATDINFIIQFLLHEASTENSQFNFTIQMESILINHIDEFLQNENTKRLPVSSIYRILQKCNKSQIPNGELFDLIMNSIPNFFVLFSFIDIQKLSDNQFKELLKSYINCKDEYEKYFQYLPFNLIFISELKNKINQLEKEKNISEQSNEQLKSELRDSKQKSDTFQFQLNYLKSQFQNKLIEVGQNNEKIQSEMIVKNQQNEKLQFQINDLNRENGQLKKQVNDFQLQFNEFQKQINFYKNECEKLQEQCEKLKSMLEEEEEKEEDLFDPFAPTPSFNDSKSKGDQIKLQKKSSNHFVQAKASNNSDLYNNLQDQFEPLEQSKNGNYSEPLQDPFESIEQNKNGNYSEPLQDPFETLEQNRNSNYSELLRAQFESIEQNKNSNYSEPLQDPFPTEEEAENSSNNERFGSFPFANINSNNADPFGTPKGEKEDDDLFESFQNNFSIIANNQGDQFSSPNLFINSQENSFSFIGGSNASINSNSINPFVTQEQVKNSVDFEPLQDPFPTSEDEKKHSNDFGFLQGQFHVANSSSSNQIQNHAFFGGNYNTDPFSKF